MKPLSQQNLYEVLDVPFDASQAVIAEAVERAMALYAPGSLATYTLMDPEEERLLARLLDEARSTLLDPSARARYDERITGPEQAAPAPSPPAPAMDAVIRAAWPELPPVIPALQPAPDEDWEEEPIEEQPVAEVAAAPPAQQPAPQPPAAAEEARAAPPAAAPPAPSAAASRLAPILLERVVEAPVSQRDAAPAPATPAPEPAAAPPAQAEVPLVPEDAVWSGAVLRRIREARGMSLQQVSERTKVTRHHVENVEADRFDQLPATVYLRGILLSLARELRLDGQKVARSYLERMAAARVGGPSQRPR